MIKLEKSIHICPFCYKNIYNCDQEIPLNGSKILSYNKHFVICINCSKYNFSLEFYIYPALAQEECFNETKYNWRDNLLEQIEDFKDKIKIIRKREEINAKENNNNDSCTGRLQGSQK